MDSESNFGKVINILMLEWEVLSRRIVGCLGLCRSGANDE